MLCVQPPITSTAWVTTILTLKWWYVRVGSEMGTSCRMRQPKSSYGATVIDARASHVIFPLGWPVVRTRIMRRILNDLFEGERRSRDLGSLRCDLVIHGGLLGSRMP